MKHAVLIFGWLFLCSLLSASSPVYGPEVFTREKGGPTVFGGEFDLCSNEGDFLLKVENGTENGENRVSSAGVSINGQDIILTSDFNQNVFVIEQPILNLQGHNVISVSMTAKPGGFITVTILGDVNCGLRVEITFPEEGNIVNYPVTIMQGTLISDSKKVKVNVMGNPGMVDTGHAGNHQDPFIWYGKSYVKQEESTEISVTAVNDLGEEDQDSVTVFGSHDPEFVFIHPEETDVLVFSETRFYTKAEMNNITQCFIDYQGDGTWEVTEGDIPDDVIYYYQDPGFYTPRIQICNESGKCLEDMTWISVRTQAELDAELNVVWQAFRTALSAHDLNAVEGFYTQSGWLRHKPAIQLLMDHDDIDEAVADMAEIHFVSYKNGIAEYLLIHEVNGENYGNYIYFVKVGNGLWQIDDF